VFDKHGIERIKEWRTFRASLETVEKPLEKTAIFWSKAPFVNNYLNPYQPDTWPDPWRLVLGNELDDLAIALGMCYTLKLTKRFSDSRCEIHKSTNRENEIRHFCVVDDTYVLNLEYRQVAEVQDMHSHNPYLIWTSPVLN